MFLRRFFNSLLCFSFILPIFQNFKKEIKLMCDYESSAFEINQEYKLKSISSLSTDSNFHCYDFYYGSTSRNEILVSNDNSSEKTRNGFNPSPNQSVILNNKNAKSYIDYSDNRMIVNNYGYYPITSIVEVNCYFSNYSLEEHGTGTVINCDLVLTAAHCIYNTSIKTIADYCGICVYNSFGGLDSIYYPTDIIIPKEYVDNKNDDYDWAILRFDEGFGMETGFLGMKTNYSVTSNTIVYTLGLADDDSGIIRLYQTNSKGSYSNNSNAMELYGYVKKGMSGGPLIIYENNKPYIISISRGLKEYSKFLWFGNEGYTIYSIKANNQMSDIMYLMENCY